MMSVEKTKDWVRENVPMLMFIFENKYVGMVYDRFASLPVAKQKQVIVGSVVGVMSLLVIHLLYSYLSLWSTQSQAAQSHAMVSTLNQYQRNQREQSGELRMIERNGALAASGKLKSYLISQGRAATISTRLITAEESSEGEEANATQSDIQMKRATVKIQRVNLNQLKNYLQGIEFGQYKLDVSSVKIHNDDKIRGYMDVDLGVVAYLFGSGTEEAEEP